MLLYADDVVFMYHSRSKDTPPGCGVGERIDRDGEAFRDLAGIEHWRRVLSNFAPSPFELDDLRWASVEHYFQAAKFREKAPDYYRSFALDSESALSGAIGPEVKRAGGRRGMPLDQAELDQWHEQRFEVMAAAHVAKYEQNELHRRVLLATLDAKLTHRPPRSAFTQTETGLMRVRQSLR